MTYLLPLSANKRPAPVDGGRKATLVGGTRINIYMDAASHATAKQLGRGNVSEGIRLALANSVKTDDVSVVQST